ncbi:MAG: MXAN_5187 C-terminal domain-containing protein [Acidobacteriota bacterium]
MDPKTRRQRLTANAGEGTDKAAQFDMRMNRLTSQIRKLEVDYRRFFAGDLLVPPDELRDAIQREVRLLRSANIKGVAENFRLNSLEARLNSHLELFGRQLRKRELGEDRRRADGTAPRHDPEKGVVIDRGLEDTAVQALYRGLHGKSQTATMDIDRFRSVLARHADAIRSKTGCDEIQFRVASEGGKLKLKAKPIRQ